ncbi:hypothetical protein [Chelativorans salis]|uniref:SMI1/KNR4 family protein n=1 Tax=Chelativorans salis TaxID=2978478 RepID=A0ABT2LQS2_9HYPH|nr:hypothetical protein [Chelativorans sp. EGI FJ00035]MCT7376901.1 hypothetical protein [Chelativorans sp. EGI FJ00035]
MTGPLMNGQSTPAEFGAWLPACEEYFRDYSEGYFDEGGQMWYIRKRKGVEIAPQRSALIIGDAGVDGVDFCFRVGMMGVWAYYPYEAEHRRLAPSVRQFLDEWLSGSITV